MKLLFTSIIFILNSALVFSQEAEFYLKEKTVKFPDTEQGETLEHTFVFTNTGSSPLIIQNYEVACKCTKLITPDKPIAPGEKGELLLTFDTKGKYEFQDRTVILTMNTKKKTEKLRFKVFVIVP